MRSGDVDRSEDCVRAHLLVDFSNNQLTNLPDSIINFSDERGSRDYLGKSWYLSRSNYYRNLNLTLPI
jgi:hypothetical protein